MRLSLFTSPKTLVLAALLACAASSGQAQETDCFDADVSATIVRQTPTVIPDCDDCIVMSWPWIVDLQVRQVHSGGLRRGRLTVLTVQHTDFRTDLGAIHWWLRRNASGGFNVVGMLTETPPPRCAPDAPPATPYITTSQGQTLDDLRRQGEARYRH